MTNFKSNIYFVMIAFLLSSYSGANKLNSCKVTPEHHSNYEPQIFPNSNNLLRTPGEMPLYCGEKLLIRGKLVDKNCVPISDAKIYIWQVACDGKYPYTPLRNVHKKEDINLKSSATFTGAGTTITDNKGEFYFITTYPASFRGMKPHIDFKITHRYFNQFATRFYTTKIDSEIPPVNFTTPFYNIDGTLTNEVLIVLPEKHPTREF